MVWGSKKKRVDNEDYQRLLENGEQMLEYGSVVDSRFVNSNYQGLISKVPILLLKFSKICKRNYERDLECKCRQLKKVFQ